MIIVSHDRHFLNNVATQCLVFEQANVNEYIGGYDDWQQHQNKTTNPTIKKTKTTKTAQPTSRKQKRSYKEQRELDSLPLTIETLEEEINELQIQMSATEFYKEDKVTIAQTQDTLKQKQNQLELAYSRWEELENE